MTINNITIAIISIVYKASGNYLPRSFTARACIICKKRDETAIKQKADALAETWRQSIEYSNTGIKLTYTIKIDINSVSCVDTLGFSNDDAMKSK